MKYGAASARWYLGTRVRRSGWGQTWGEATWEGEQYLFQPQTDWDHCRVCRIRPLAGTGPAGNLAAEGRREISKRVKTTSYTLGGGAVLWAQEPGHLKRRQGNQSSGTAHAGDVLGSSGRPQEDWPHYQALRAAMSALEAIPYHVWLGSRLSRVWPRERT